ncbi:glycosyltransferase family 4 protein [Haloterrigena salifodinae]|uniref:glycosyltransferase family 4 protein n=1 Tax=Haloterrigena salifodinae TaxID=2675099 RepID=UPI000F85E92C|nr:glycosyltransferase family 4 protein [Haloterrigena salifodinae]
MRILFVTHRYPPHAGGVETHVQEIATRLVDRGHEVTVYSADAGPDVPTESTSDGVRVRRFHSLNPDGAFYAAPRMALAVRRADADIVHAHNYHAFPLFFAALGVSNKRFIVTTHYHGASASSPRNVLLSLYRPLGRRAIRQADEIVAVSEWEHNQLQEDFGVNATVIPNGLNVERFAEAEPEERPQPYLLCVGRLEEYKGIQHVIQALSELPEYDLLVAGSGPYREELEQIAHEEGVADRVDFLGFVDDERLPGLYAGADVYVTLSTFEAYGMTVAEALAAGTPCVVREASALLDWMSESGVEGVSSTSPEVVASALRNALSQTPDSDIKTWTEISTCLAARFYNHEKGNSDKDCVHTA